MSDASTGAARAALGSAKALVFDLDGTLIDSRQDIALATNFALEQIGQKPLSTDEIAAYVGDGALALIQRASGLSLDDPQLAQVHGVFREYYTAHAVVHTKPYSTVMSTLRILHGGAGRARGLRLALCTNKPRATTEQVLRQLRLDEYLEVVTAADDFANKKPHPESLLFIARQFGLRPAQLVMVGDGPQDIECALRAGAIAVGVNYGIKTADEMRAAGPHHVIDEFADLLGLLGIAGQ